MNNSDMKTIYMLSSFDCIDGLFDDFAVDDEDLRQIALNNYFDIRDKVEVQIEVRPLNKSIIRISEDGKVRAVYHIFKVNRVNRKVA